MSKWTEIRDSIVAEAKATKIDEAVKQSVTQHIYDTVLPALREVGDSFTDIVKEQSKSESGWCKIRDGIALPICIQSGLWLAEKLLGYIIKKTADAQTAGAAEPTA